MISTQFSPSKTPKSAQRLAKVAALVALMFGFGCAQGDDARAWQALSSNPSVAAIDSFLLLYPESGYKEAALQKKEDFLWQLALNDNTEYGYKLYQKNYPQGKFVELVTSKIDSIPSDDIGLASLTTRTFVGKLQLGEKEIQVLSMRFLRIEETGEQANFEATINISDARKNLIGSINKNRWQFNFEEGGQSPVLGLTSARAYIRDNQIWIESTNPDHFWRVRCDR